MFPLTIPAPSSIFPLSRVRTDVFGVLQQTEDAGDSGQVWVSATPYCALLDREQHGSPRYVMTIIHYNVAKIDGSGLPRQLIFSHLTYKRSLSLSFVLIESEPAVFICNVLLTNLYFKLSQ